MRVDEALGFAEQDQYSSDPVFATLAAEVERLRSENELLKAERDGQRQIWAMSHKSRGDLVEWFTSREPLITRMLWAPTHTAFLERARIIDWEREHPQPEVDE